MKEIIKKNRRFLAGMSIILLMGLYIIATIRLNRAEIAAATCAADPRINTRYVYTGNVRSREDLLLQIMQLAIWEENARNTIDDVFGYDENYETEQGKKYGLEKEEDLLTYAKSKRWRVVRDQLDQTVRETVKLIFSKIDKPYEINEELVIYGYEHGGFKGISDLAEIIESNNAREAYQYVATHIDEKESALPIAVASGLYSDLITTGCEKSLEEVHRNNTLDTLRNTVCMAEKYEKYFQLKMTGLENARRVLSRMEYNSIPDIPELGMSVAEARKTRLGDPSSESEKFVGSWCHEKHIGGEMIWYKDGKQIFKVQYLDDKITTVFDTRYKQPGQSRTATYTRTSNSTTDADDYDIDSYYEDNRDDYDNYEDAYDGFLDNAGAWDDY